ncbi:hypothetical protein Rleg2_4143 [Rhizobium leguminosarum bv. trifolii WSM2304]|uniref:Lipoprotein n=1 Tax=Rhizobium leguminosarum bv. trifolii (strain WSM2304) TaxID=395492 RepID=A0ABF7QT59_RHILW|nr:hypothetical protein [Rhizobium leguminosarum]ACI57405.1 hypothetical protein Rleg2_4143 [Rhizobium leguminosarum bv. trifolii WSM2304]
MDRRSIFALGLLALAGCQSGAEHQAQIDAMLDGRLAQYNGRPISEFMAATGMTPVDAYPVSEGRVFIFKTAPVYMTLPATNVTPAVTRAAQCQLLVRTTNESKSSGADAWIVRGTERSGACNNLP